MNFLHSGENISPRDTVPPMKLQYCKKFLTIWSTTSEESCSYADLNSVGNTGNIIGFPKTSTDHIMIFESTDEICNYSYKSPDNNNSHMVNQVSDLEEIAPGCPSLPKFSTSSLLPQKSTVINEEGLKRETFGVRRPGKPHKIILLVGETGTGKSTLINAMVNHMLGVRCNDRMWCEITETKEKQTDSQTTAVTVYDVFADQSPISLTVIDTPGYGSTAGIEEDLKVPETLHKLFGMSDGVQKIDAVGLVVSSKSSRLTDRQLYIFDAVLSLFAKDVEQNIAVLITSVTNKPTNVIQAIKTSKIKCAETNGGKLVYFCFDNCHCEGFNAEYEDEMDEEEEADEFQKYEKIWRKNEKNMNNFFAFLNQTQTIDLVLTESVLKQRKQLTASISNLKDRINEKELKTNELEQTKLSLTLHKEKRDMKNFVYEVDEPYKIKVPINSGRWHMSKEATCCTVCEENCHYPGCWWVSDLSWCSVMKKGKCTVCTGKCDYSFHIKEAKIYKLKTRKVKRTHEHLKMKFDTEFIDIQSLIYKLEEKIKQVEAEKSRLVEECYQCVLTLEAIALTASAVSTLKHLDFLIEKLIGTLVMTLRVSEQNMPSDCDVIDDIEDMVTPHEPTPHERQFSRKSVVPRARRRKALPLPEELQADSVIPGTQKVWVKTWGCSHNNSDGEYMAGQLAASGYKMSGSTPHAPSFCRSPGAPTEAAKALRRSHTSGSHQPSPARPSRAGPGRGAAQGHGVARLTARPCARVAKNGRLPKPARRPNRSERSGLRKRRRLRTGFDRGAPSSPARPDPSRVKRGDRQAELSPGACTHSSRLLVWTELAFPRSNTLQRVRIQMTAISWRYFRLHTAVVCSWLELSQPLAGRLGTIMLTVVEPFAGPCPSALGNCAVWEIAGHCGKWVTVAGSTVPTVAHLLEAANEGRSLDSSPRPRLCRRRAAHDARADRSLAAPLPSAAPPASRSCRPVQRRNGGRERERERERDGDRDGGKLEEEETPERSARRSSDGARCRERNSREGEGEEKVGLRRTQQERSREPAARVERAERHAGAAEPCHLRSVYSCLIRQLGRPCVLRRRRRRAIGFATEHSFVKSNEVNVIVLSGQQGDLGSDR
ncbi:hypothetical protein P4O66_001287 [Electrophorus voltai]|uniref:MTTase N-terminal domain-containing protein n=1 Tax=Electrophorus voltai TaxID=2609070 RepID=A0AAD8Z812_9TELE|nr:hypothetical protein P4O66_001287 [Electrophorus voltai]